MVCGTLCELALVYSYSGPQRALGWPNDYVFARGSALGSARGRCARGTVARILSFYFQSGSRQSKSDESRDAGTALGHAAGSAIDSGASRESGRSGNRDDQEPKNFRGAVGSAPASAAPIADGRSGVPGL